MIGPGRLVLESPWMLLGLLPVGAVGVYILLRKRPTFRFATLSLVSGLPSTLTEKMRWLPDVLRLIALSFVVLALARPQLVGPPQHDESSGIDIVMVIDTSCSMRAVDFQPKDRMFVAKKSIEEFVMSRTSDRIGLVAFGAEAATWVPLTLDYSMLAKMLNELEVGMLGDGTAIGTAVGTGLNRLRKSEAESRVVVLVTDGDNNAGEISPTKAAKMAKELGVPIYTILIGQGGPVPFPAGKDIFGRVVLKKQVIPTNPELLQKMASLTGGESYRATDKDELDKRLTEVLDSLERSKLEATLGVETYAELFPYALMMALMMLALELLLRATRFQRFP